MVDRRRRVVRGAETFRLQLALMDPLENAGTCTLIVFLLELTSTVCVTRVGKSVIWYYSLSMISVAGLCFWLVLWSSRTSAS